MATRTTMLTLVAALIAANDLHPRDKAPDERVIQLGPYTVHAVYPAVNVRFALSRQNLFAPLADPIAEARVVWVENEDPTGLRTQDVLLGLNGTELAGLTLRQIATLVTQARQSGTVVWKIRRGRETVQLPYDGSWRVPLPGLLR